MFMAPVAAMDETTGVYSAVENVAVQSRYAHRVKLTWDEVANTEQYQVRVVNPNKKLVTKVRANDNKATVRELKPNHTYTMRVRTISENQMGDYSEPIDVITKPVGAITLTADGATVTWTIDGETTNGVKVVWSKTAEPTYPTRETDTYQYISDQTQTSLTLNAFDGSGTYYVRVCQYLGSGKCGVYSNEVTVELEEQEVVSITLEQTEGEEVEWSTEGYAAKGYKLVWSLEPEPTYPPDENDDYKYYSSGDTTSGEIDDSFGAGTYYVRVCEYTGSGCDVYSNEITIDL